MDARIQAARERLKEVISEYSGPTLDDCEREVVNANRASIAAQERLAAAKKELDDAAKDVERAIQRCRMARHYQESAANHEHVINSWAESIAVMESAEVENG